MKRNALIAGGYALLLLAVFHRVWRGTELFGWDCLREYWPDLVFPVDALRAGELPLWNPYGEGGYPFWADPQAGFLHPTSWLCYLLSAVTGDNGPWLIQLKVLVNLWMGLVGMHLLCARRNGSDLAGALGAIVLVFGSPLLVHKNGALLWPMLYLPWAMLALERFLEAPGPGRGAQLGLGLWLIGTAGHPQSFWYGLIIVGAYWLFRTLRAPGALRAQWKGLLVAGAVALALLAPLYVPAAQAIALSGRGTRGLGYVLQLPMGANHLLELFVPNLDANWMLDVYVGPVALVLALIGAVTAEKRAEGCFWLAVALFGLVLALGENTPVLPFLAKYMPGFGLHRIAYRHKLIFGFAIAVAAAGGLDAARRNPRLLWAMSAAWIVPVAIVAIRVPAARWAVLLSAPALLLLGTRARVLAIGLVLADLLVAGKLKLDILQPPPALARDRETLARMDTQYRYLSDNLVPHYLPILRQMREFGGLNPMALRRREDIVARDSIPLLEKMNVRWWWTGKRLPLPQAGPSLYTLPDAVPMARVYPSAEILPADQVLARLAVPGSLGTALVEPGDGPAGLPKSTFSPTDGKVTSYRRNTIELEVSAPSAGILVVAEPYFPDWRAEVDGNPAAVFRVNYFLRGVVVPAGASHVVLRYSPPLALPLWVLFGVGLSAALLVARRSRPPLGR